MKPSKAVRASRLRNLRPPLLMVAGGAGITVCSHALGQHTEAGRAFDHAAELALVGEPGLVRFIVLRVLYIAVSLPSVGLALLAVPAAAWLRGRRWTAFGIFLVIAGSNVTTRILKHHVFDRPGTSGFPDNGLPSGHATGALAFLLAVILLQPRARGISALLAALLGMSAALATLWGGTHRPVDVTSAAGVCALWVGIALPFAQKDAPIHLRSQGTAPADPGSHGATRLAPLLLCATSGALIPALVLLVRVVLAKPTGLSEATLVLGILVGLIGTTVAVAGRHIVCRPGPPSATRPPPRWRPEARRLARNQPRVVRSIR